ncbi:DNA-binding IclR family transcriptional regulator [Rhodoligotrophos appendicifer]|uniref:IclR family transcriptional regulator n=1 Tax=Rhodoligotrophos appendicifer TaxID=987056 RepID=UPI001184AD1D|nr:IclR family transcriptional regulator [Rhodoligotrophos appendicifer]
MSESENSAVKTAARTLDIFEAFAQAGEPLTLTELADRIGIPLSSCHALVRTLQARGYVYLFERRRWIFPTKRLFDIAQAITRHDPLLKRIQPLLVKLRDQTGETVILGKRQLDEVIYLDVVEGHHTIRYSAQPGAAKPLHSSAAGKVILSRLSIVELEKLIGRIGLRPMTAGTIVDFDTLRADLEEGRGRGYFSTRGENVVDVGALGMPLTMTGETLALTVAGPLDRIEAHLEANLSAMRAVLDLLSDIDREAALEA